MWIVQFSEKKSAAELFGPHFKDFASDSNIYFKETIE